jgi:hypothetical protein
MKIFLLILVSITNSYSISKYNGFNYCILHRHYNGLGDYMEQINIYKYKKKIPETYEYSLSEITNLTVGKKVESQYREKPFKSRDSINLLSAKVNNPELTFIRKELFKHDIEGTYIHACPYVLRERFN